MLPNSQPRSGVPSRPVVSQPKVQATQPSSVPASASAALPKRLLPTRYAALEPAKPLSVVNDDPVFNTYAAGTILGLSEECMKKWRQRGQGPDYYQYGEDGPVRYRLSDLMRFRAAYKVHQGGKQ